MRVPALLAAAILCGCASVASATIENRLVALGLDEQRASCLSADLGSRLTDTQMATLATHMVSLSRSESPREVVQSLARVDDAAIASAVITSGASCLLAPR